MAELTYIKNSEELTGFLKNEMPETADRIGALQKIMEKRKLIYLGHILSIVGLQITTKIGTYIATLNFSPAAVSFIINNDMLAHMSKRDKIDVYGFSKDGSITEAIMVNSSKIENKLSPSVMVGKKTSGKNTF